VTDFRSEIIGNSKVISSAVYVLVEELKQKENELDNIVTHNENSKII